MFNINAFNWCSNQTYRWPWTLLSAQVL